MQERLRVYDSVSAVAHGDLIATEFTLVTHGFAYPPDSGVEEEQALDCDLKQVADIVPAANVAQLMRQHGLKLFARKAQQGAYGQDDGGAPDTHGERRNDFIRHSESHGAPNIDSFAD